MPQLLQKKTRDSGQRLLSVAALSSWMQISMPMKDLSSQLLHMYKLLKKYNFPIPNPVILTY